MNDLLVLYVLNSLLRSICFEEIHHFIVRPPRSLPQCCPAVLVFSIDIGTFIKKKYCHFKVTLIGRQNQCCLTVLAFSVDLPKIKILL